MNITRRWFIGGAASFGAFAGCRFFKSDAFNFSKKPNLTLGIISDIHISTAAKPGDSIFDAYNDLTFRRTLEWYRDEGVDAVMIAGDMADTGMVDQLQIIGKAWDDIFPNDLAPDGHRVEKLFIYGNHDYHGYLYGDFAAKHYPDPTERNRHILRADMAGWWKKIFHEDYAPLYRKDINGYSFIGQHWDDGKGPETKYGSAPTGAELEAYLAANGKSLDPTRPFFFFQHPHLKDTCYGAWAWGHDSGITTRVLSAYPNAIAFSGHSHYSLTDEHSIWQGAFTSIGTGSLRYTCLPDDRLPPRGYENARSEIAEERPFNPEKLTREYDFSNCRQGMLCRIYDDCIVLRRREFLSQNDLGADWVMPLPVAESKPFAYAEHAKKIGAPAFDTDAKLILRRLKAKSRGALEKEKKSGEVAAAVDALEVAIPPAVAKDGARVLRYELTFSSKEDEKTLTRYVVAEGFNFPCGHPRTRIATKCVLALADMPKGDLICRVTPVSCFGRKGAPIETTFIRS